MRNLAILGAIFVVLDLVGAAALFFGRDGGDAATRGLGQGLGVALAALGVVAALLLYMGQAGGRSVFVIVGLVLSAAPFAGGVALTVSRQQVLALIFPSMRDRTPREPSRSYAFPDSVTREAAMAIVYNDYAKLDTLLRGSPAPDLTARDEAGATLLGLATTAAVMEGGAMRDLDGLKLLLAAGAKPVPDAMGREQSLIEVVAHASDERRRMALEMLLDAGLSPDTRMHDGRSVLFHPYLTPDAARVLLARGIDKMVHDTRGDAADWSPVTYQADLGNWATALVLLEGGVPRDYGNPPGSILARVTKVDDASISTADSARKAFADALRK
jgi:hypothetical protein